MNIDYKIYKCEITGYFIIGIFNDSPICLILIVIMNTQKH